MSINTNPFTSNSGPREFIPTTNKQSFPLNMNATFTPAANSDYTFDQSITLVEEPQCEMKGTSDKYKTELCKNWIENNTCRYGKKCQFAHGKEELAAFTGNTEEKLRTKNCRTFYKTSHCAYGSRCMFR